MNLKQAKQLKKGDHVTAPRYSAGVNDVKRYKVTSLKTWKRNPARIEIGLKHGLFTFEKANENDLELLTKE